MRAMMLRSCLLALGCVVVCQAARIIQAPPDSTEQNTRKQPDFCNVECLDFKSICETDDYEVRKYKDAKWVSTTVTDVTLTKAGMRGFGRLSKYLDEENDAGVKIPTAHPVLIQVPTERTSLLSERYTVSLLLPMVYWDDPPEPTNTAVFIENTPEMVVYVKSYGGWASGSNAHSNYVDLVGKLKENNETFKDGFYFVAQYDAPSQESHRRNEIWVLGSSIMDQVYPKRKADFTAGSVRPFPIQSCAKSDVRMSGPIQGYAGNALPQCGDREEFCLDKECPEYQVIERYDSGIERRRYTGIKMVSVTSEMCDVMQARTVGFWFLSNYINGSNGYKEKMNPTTPVLLDVNLKDTSGRIEPACDKINTVSFYLPKENQQDTPEPVPQKKLWSREFPQSSRDQEVFLQTVDMDVYVQCFDGYAVKNNIIRNYRELRQGLRAEGKCYKPGVMRVASYNDPGVLFARHNEVWLDTDDECAKENPDEIALKGWEEIRNEDGSEEEDKKDVAPAEDKTTLPYILPVDDITDTPHECEISECPKYKTVKKYENFVQRSVINATMVCTKTVSCSYEAAAMKNFLLLFQYISGQNSAGIKITMTAPVLTKTVKVRGGDTCEREHTTCFFLPKEHQANPPKPKNDQLFIDDEHTFDVWVMAFDGWATDDKVEKLIHTFMVQLVNQYVPYTENYFVASYDAPWKTKRYNELWNLRAGPTYRPRHDSDESFKQTTETSHEVSRNSMHEMCEDVDCPEYQSIKKFNNFEEREIMPGMWVCKKNSDCSLTQTPSSLWSLLNYISGSNDRNVTIKTTAPVLRTINPADFGRKGCDKETTVCFWLPKEHQNNPPQPTEDGVYLYESRGPVAYVMTYGGVEETEEDFSRRALKFMHILDGAGISFKPEYVKAVTYDGPEVPNNKRLNEIWLIKPEHDDRVNLSEEDSEEALDPVEERCSQQECPEYRDVRQHNGFVERSITPGTWVCKNTRRCSLTETDSAFWSLYNYFAGNNSKKARVTMTSPVLHAMNPADLERDSCDKLSKLCLWLPTEHQKDPPQPTEDGVYLYQSRGPHAYVLTYSGVRAEGEEEFAARAREFMNMLEEAGIEYKPEYVKAISYDGPNVPVRKRVHEIWLIKPEPSDSREILDPVSEKCKRIECPEYKSIREHDGFEEKRVIPGMWVCKKSTGCSTTSAFRSLFYYISGSNSKNAKIKMTAPVLRIMNPADLDREDCDKETKTCFWLPEKHQEDPPQPTEDGVYLYRSRGPVAYVLTYSGERRGRDKEFQRRAKEFMSKLDWAGLKYKREYVKSVGYDGPSVPDSKRVSEIWLVKSEDAEDYRGKVLSTMEDRCKVMDCPNYWSIKKHDGFEERRIMPGTWICKNFSACTMEEASTEFSWAVLGYQSGGNSKKAKIRAETPAVIWMHPSVLNTRGCNKDYTICLWLPKEHQEDPPKSVTHGSGAMFLYHSRGPVVYAMPYNASFRDKTDKTFTQHAVDFMDKLDAAGIEYKQEYVKSAMFGGGPRGEIHEVWLVKPERSGHTTGKQLTAERMCQSLDCPEYQSVQKYDGFEKRRIMPGTWVCKNVTGCSMEEASNVFAWSMLAYVSGSNNKEAELDANVPILRQMNPVDMVAEGCEKDYRMCFWLPRKYQEDPPVPRDSSMYLYQSRGPVVYTMAYSVSKEVKDEVFARRATKFMDMLDQTGIPYKKEYVKSVTYDGGPSGKRLHEVWLVEPEE
ncbi:uncharacterized protein [Branchiostoma lanceolatum]|uniref:uncharacterized protein n=1 Tax=Branchiostoma lanceolatum TaxID=7740 RepID=UPI003456DD0C